MNLVYKFSTAVVLLTALIGASLAQAETLKCKLHISESTKESSALVAPPNAGVSLSRYAIPASASSPMALSRKSNS